MELWAPGSLWLLHVTPAQIPEHPQVNEFGCWPTGLIRPPTLPIDYGRLPTRT